MYKLERKLLETKLFSYCAIHYNTYLIQSIYHTNKKYCHDYLSIGFLSSKKENGLSGFFIIKGFKYDPDYYEYNGQKLFNTVAECILSI